MAEMLSQGHALLDRSAARRWLADKVDAAPGGLSEEQWLLVLRSGLLESSEAAADSFARETCLLGRRVDAPQLKSLCEALRQLLPSFSDHGNAQVVGRLAVQLVNLADGPTVSEFGIALAYAAQPIVIAALFAAVRLFGSLDTAEQVDNAWNRWLPFTSQVLRGSSSLDAHCFLRNSLSRLISARHETVAIKLASHSLNALSMYNGPRKMGSPIGWVADLIGFGVDPSSVATVLELTLASAIELNSTILVENLIMLQPWTRPLVTLAVDKLGRENFAWAVAAVVLGSLPTKLDSGACVLAWALSVLAQSNQPIHQPAFVMLQSVLTLLGAISGLSCKASLDSCCAFRSLTSSSRRCHNRRVASHQVRSFSSTFLVSASAFDQVEEAWSDPDTLASLLPKMATVFRKLESSEYALAVTTIIATISICLLHESTCVRAAAAKTLGIIPAKTELLLFLPMLLKVLSNETCGDVVLELFSAFAQFPTDGPSSVPVVSMLGSLVDQSPHIGDCAILSMSTIASRVPLVAFPPLARALDSRFKQWGRCSPADHAVITSAMLLVTTNRPSKGTIFVPVIQQSIVAAEESPLAASFALRALEVLCCEGVLEPKVALKLVMKNFSVLPREMAQMSSPVRKALLSCLRCSSRISGTSKGAVVAKKCTVALRAVLSEPVLSSREAAVAADALSDFEVEEILDLETNEEDDPEIEARNLESSETFVGWVFSWLQTKMDGSVTKKFVELLVLITKGEWTSRLRNAFAEDKLRKLRMTSAALQRARTRGQEPIASTPAAVAKEDFLEYVSFLPHGVIRRVTETASEILSDNPAERVKASHAFDVLFQSEALTSGLPWGKILLHFFKDILPSIGREQSWIDLSGVVNAVFALPPESSGTLPFVLTTRQGGCLASLARANLPTVARNVIRKDLSGLVEEFLLFCVDNRELEAIAAGLDSAKLVTAEPPLTAARQWTLLSMKAHVSGTVPEREEYRVQLAETLGSWAREDAMAVLNDAAADDDLDRWIRRVCVHVGAAARPGSNVTVRSSLAALSTEQMLCKLASGSRNDCHSRLLRICGCLNALSTERVDQVDFASQCLTVKRSASESCPELCDNLGLISAALIVSVFGLWPLCERASAESFNPRPLLSCCANPSASNERRLVALLTSEPAA